MVEESLQGKWEVGTEFGVNASGSFILLLPVPRVYAVVEMPNAEYIVPQRYTKPKPLASGCYV